MAHNLLKELLCSTLSTRLLICRMPHQCALLSLGRYWTPKSPDISFLGDVVCYLHQGESKPPQVLIRPYHLKVLTNQCTVMCFNISWQMFPNPRIELSCSEFLDTNVSCPPQGAELRRRRPRDRLVPNQGRHGLRREPGVHQPDVHQHLRVHRTRPLHDQQ